MRSRTLRVAICAVLLLGALLPVGSTSASTRAQVRAAKLGDAMLKLGSHSADVKQLQVLLTKRGFRVAADGWFGKQTLTAVKNAQRAYGLVVDGLVGPATLRALRAGPPHGHAGSGRCSSTPGGGDAVTRWRPVVACVLGLLHRSPAHVDDVLIVIRYESSGNPRAINDFDMNAQNGDPSRGLMQTIGATFSAYRSSALPNDIFDPAANIYAGLAYGIARYGSISNIPGVKSINAGGNYRPYAAVRPAPAGPPASSP
jgi:hypothetical protein